MTLNARTIEGVISQARKAWHRLGVNENAAAEMAEELAADLTAAALDGKDVSAYIGGDVDSLAASWAVERGLFFPQPRLKETALAAAKGAALPALAATAFWFIGWSGALDPSYESLVTTPGGVRWEIRKSPDPGLPLMWVGWGMCALSAFFMVRRAVATRLQRLLAPAHEATVRALTIAFPLIILAGALIVGAIQFLAPYTLGDYFALILGLPAGLVGMIATVAAGSALVHHRTYRRTEAQAM
ncbi:hypothetical protein ACN6AT_36855 (plasmid) [Streptomyces sp. JL4002]|uniref:hypothetical protein n=1 Tax=Streptomyces sp. JL4002 TaxID=3404781 RepID=UPI003B280D35